MNLSTFFLAIFHNAITSSHQSNMLPSPFVMREGMKSLIISTATLPTCYSASSRQINLFSMKLWSNGSLARLADMLSMTASLKLMLQLLWHILFATVTRGSAVDVIVQMLLGWLLGRDAATPAYEVAGLEPYEGLGGLLIVSVSSATRVWRLSISVMSPSILDTYSFLWSCGFFNNERTRSVSIFTAFPGRFSIGDASHCAVSVLAYCRLLC